ncbi:phosphorylase b kinase regulatory subunit beta-like [Clytia hemisphaerica]|uniref:Phosphorylase b kinase regulatory subunit n=1 Tax=Clytia hemisphaerica TaxID=252671 RepID=A0A7M5VEA5_9CNID|eukprot:TCONS_00030256-protein
MVENRNELLDEYYNQVTKEILHHQSLTHGLFPLDTSHESEAEGHVRDNVYCAISIWALGLAYRHVDDDEGRTFELEQSAVKCMRGILFFYMRQSEQLEKFKIDQHYSHALHSKFNIHTTDVIDEQAHNKLQLDVVALYLLALSQMIASGLYIIFTIDEVNFIQNLVYYIERAYRIADYGIWECGTRYNDGHRELHASSVGMVKAALEAINGLNLFGNKGTLNSVVYVDPDAHFRNRSILHSLLPRESSSKTTDAALLSIIGFPGFAVIDEDLRRMTKDKVLNNLLGRYGLKRFFRDGHGTVLENRTKRFYERAELKQFEGLESQWPLFFLYLSLDALFGGDVNKANDYMTQTEGLIPFISGVQGKVFPKYYYVEKSDITLELSNPNEATRYLNDNIEKTYFLWGQSLYIMTKLLLDGLISIHEIDPLGRSNFENSTFQHLGLKNQRYSSFQMVGSDILQVCLISEHRTLQANLATYGIDTQTPKEIEPIVICAPHDIVQVFEELGKNKKLGLTGRPRRPLGALGTSKIYKILGKTVVTYPINFDEKDFYMTLDMSLLIDELKSTLSFISRSWNMHGRPTVCFFLREHNFRGEAASEMVNFMSELKSGTVDGTKVKLGKLQTMVSTGCVEHLDYLEPRHCTKIDIITNDDESDYLTFSGFESVYHPKLNCEEDEIEIGSETQNLQRIEHMDDQDIKNLFGNSSGMTNKMTCLQMLQQRHGPAFDLNGKAIRDCIQELYTQACYVHKWSVVRQGATLLNKTVASLAPSVTAMLVAGKQVTIGVFGKEETVISEPLSPKDVKEVIHKMCFEHDVREVSLQQEMVIYLANIISTKPKLFTGMLKIHIGWILHTMKSHLENIEGCSHNIYSMYPNEIKALATCVLDGKGKFRTHDVEPQNEYQKRRWNGALHRVPSKFYRHVWSILQRSKHGLTMYTYTLPQEPVLTEMTAGETAFRLRVEEMLSHAKKPVHRQIIVELLMIISTILSRNPELVIQTELSLTDIVDEAIDMFKTQNEEKSKEDFFKLHPTENGGSTTYLSRAFVNKILNNNPLILSDDLQKNCSIS